MRAWYPRKAPSGVVIAFLVRAVRNRLSYGDDSMAARRVIDASREFTIAERA